MPTIRISDDSMQRLKEWAEPLEDSAEDAFRKVLEAAERDREVQGRKSHRPAARPTLRSARIPAVGAGLRAVDPKRAKKPAVGAGLGAAGLKHAKLPQREFREPLLKVIYDFGGSAQMRDVLPVLKERLDSRLLPGDFERVSTGDERWWNAACWERSELVKEGYLRDDSPRGIWALSEKGTRAVESRLKDPSGTLADHLRAMPDAGEDSDFDRSPS